METQEPPSLVLSEKWWAGEEEKAGQEHRSWLCVSLWWCGGTRSGPWSHRCRSWSRDWWVNGRYSAQCCCVPETAGSSSRPCASPSSTGWWCAHRAAARSPLCGWTPPVCDASDGRSALPLKHTARWTAPLRPRDLRQIRYERQKFNSVTNCPLGFTVSKKYDAINTDNDGRLNISIFSKFSKQGFHHRHG